MKILYKVNSRIYTVLAFSCSLYTVQSQIVKSVNTFRLRRVGIYFFFGITCLNNSFGDLFIAHSGFVNLIKHPDTFRLSINQTAKQRRRIICVSEVQPKRRFNILNPANLVDIKQFFFPVLINQPIHNSPVPKPGHSVSPRIVNFHSLKQIPVTLIKPFVTGIICCHRQCFTVGLIKKTFL